MEQKEEKIQNFSLKAGQKYEKKGTLEIQKSKIAILILNQSSNSTIFAIVRYPGGPKFVLSGDPLYLTNFCSSFIGQNFISYLDHLGGNGVSRKIAFEIH